MAVIDSLRILLQTGSKIEEINRLTLELFAINTAPIKQNAFDTFIETGDIRYVQKYEVKAAVFDMYTMYDKVSLADRLALQHTMITSIPTY